MFRSPGVRKLVLGLLLVVVTLALYNPVAHNGFVNFDDDRYVTTNPQVHAGLQWSTVPWAFTTIELANWHPLTWISYALDYRLFQLNPVGYHYTSLLLHATNALLLFLILQWFTGYTARSLMVATIFAVHPLNVESVAWVSELKNVLCMLFFLLAVAAYGWYVLHPSVGRYLSVAVLFAMALMSKPMAITLPFVLLLLDYWPLGRMRMPANANWRDETDPRFAPETQSLTTLCLEKLPLLALSAGSAVMTMFAQRAGGAVLTSAAHDPRLRLENVIVSYARYIQKAIWPSHLAALYPYPHVLPVWEVVASAIVLLAIICAALKYRQRRYLFVGWFWYLGTMVPMIGLVQVGNQAMADRYTYLPLIGFFIMTVWAVAEWASARHFSAKYVATAGITLLVAFSAVTRVQLGYWHDDLSLWSHALAVTRNNYVAENNFASALVRQGRTDAAIAHFRTASVIEPSDPTSQLNLGIYAEEHGDLAQAEARYEMALRLATDTHLRATAYANLGTVYFALHDYTRAQQNFDTALRLKGSFPIAFLDLGLIAQKTAETTGDWNRAAGYFAQSVALEPNDVGYLLLASALHHANRVEDANRAYRQALQFSTDLAQSLQRAAQLSAQ